MRKSQKLLHSFLIFLSHILKLRCASFFLLLLCTASCNTVDPPPDKTVLTLTLEDVSCTEAWITLTTNNIQLPATLNLLKDNTITKTINLQTADTLLYIDSLLPDQTYKYQVSHIAASSIQHPVSSNEITVTTLDTTSHNFTWQTWTFGEHSSSTLYDVAIVNENCIWAVGEIYMNDSLGNPDHNAYNAVHWDGQKWELKRIPIDLNGTPFYPVIHSVFAYNENDIWFGGGIHWDGIAFNQVQMNVSFPSYVNKIWGTSSNDLYIVGNAGNIAHWNGVKWTKIESGTTIDLKFITGTDNNIFVSGYNLDQSASLLLRLINNQPIVVWSNNNTTGTEPYGNIIYSIRVIRNKLFVSSNTGTYLETIGSSLPPKFLYYNPYRVYQITGTEINDIYTVGSRANINHYNGISKKEIYIDLTSISPFYCADSKLNIVAAGGTKVENVIFHKAIIIIGKRL